MGHYTPEFLLSRYTPFTSPPALEQHTAIFSREPIPPELFKDPPAGAASAALGPRAKRTLNDFIERPRGPSARGGNIAAMRPRNRHWEDTASPPKTYGFPPQQPKSSWKRPPSTDNNDSWKADPSQETWKDSAAAHTWKDEKPLTWSSAEKAPWKSETYRPEPWKPDERGVALNSNERPIRKSDEKPPWQSDERSQLRFDERPPWKANEELSMRKQPDDAWRTQPADSWKRGDEVADDQWKPTMPLHPWGKSTVEPWKDAQTRFWKNQPRSDEKPHAPSAWKDPVWKPTSAEAWTMPEPQQTDDVRKLHPWKPLEQTSNKVPWKTSTEPWKGANAPVPWVTERVVERVAEKSETPWDTERQTEGPRQPPAQRWTSKPDDAWRSGQPPPAETYWKKPVEAPSTRWKDFTEADQWKPRATSDQWAEKEQLWAKMPPNANEELGSCTQEDGRDRPLLNEDETWEYRDPSDHIRGPFTSRRMHEWWKREFFPHDLPIRRTGTTKFVPLSILYPVELQTKVLPFKHYPCVSVWTGDADSPPPGITPRARSSTTFAADIVNSVDAPKAPPKQKEPPTKSAWKPVKSQDDDDASTRSPEGNLFGGSAPEEPVQSKPVAWNMAARRAEVGDESLGPSLAESRKTENGTLQAQSGAMPRKKGKWKKQSLAEIMANNTAPPGRWETNEAVLKPQKVPLWAPPPSVAKAPQPAMTSPVSPTSPPPPSQTVPISTSEEQMIEIQSLCKHHCIALDADFVGLLTTCASTTEIVSLLLDNLEKPPETVDSFAQEFWDMIKNPFKPAKTASGRGKQLRKKRQN